MGTNQSIENIYNPIIESLFKTKSMSYDDVLEQIHLLAKEVFLTATDEDTWNIGEMQECTLDSFIIGAYWFLSDHHCGKESTEYGVFSVMCMIFKPGASTGPDRETTDMGVYEALVELMNK